MFGISALLIVSSASLPADAAAKKPSLPCGGIPAPTLCSTVALSGAETLAGEGADVASGLKIEDAKPKSCAEWTKGIGGRLRLPSATDGVGVSIPFAIKGYKGPGTYAGAASFEDVTPSLTVITPSGAYVAVASSTLTATVKADGSGSFTFTKFVENVTKKGSLNGTVSWVCKKPKK